MTNVCSSNICSIGNAADYVDCQILHFLVYDTYTPSNVCNGSLIADFAFEGGKCWQIPQVLKETFQLSGSTFSFGYAPYCPGTNTCLLMGPFGNSLF